MPPSPDYREKRHPIPRRHISEGDIYVSPSSVNCRHFLETVSRLQVFTIVWLCVCVREGINTAVG